MSVPFFDLTRQYDAIREDVEPLVADLLTTQQCIGGPYVKQLEQRLADRIEVDHAIGVSSGTDALLVSLMALEIGEGDEVICPPFTFFSPVEMVLRRGARPVFVDIDPETFNLDAGQLEAAVTEATRAVIPVHLFGQTCRMSAICEVADRHRLAVVEDMAQSIDARHRDRPAGAFGTTGCLSFYPTKNLGGAGDGGMVFCDDDELAARIRRLARHGAEPKYHHLEVGGNFRLDALQAAVLVAKLDHLDRLTAARRENARFYNQALAQIPQVTTPTVADEHLAVYNQYVIRARRRDELREHLSECGIGTNVYYPEPLHTQPPLEGFGYTEGDFPAAERACRQVLALPVFPELKESERTRVAEAIRRFYGE